MSEVHFFNGAKQQRLLGTWAYEYRPSVKPQQYLDQHHNRQKILRLEPSHGHIYCANQPVLIDPFNILARELPGHQQDVQREYLRAQLMVTISRYEGLGLVTAEAIAHGLPTVGFGDCPGTNEIIQHCVNGMFVKPSNNQTRAEARAITLSELMEDHRKRLALTQASFSLPSTADIAKR